MGGGGREVGRDFWNITVRLAILNDAWNVGALFEDQEKLNRLVVLE